MEIDHQRISLHKEDKVTWLARQIFEAFPEECTGLKVFTLDCGCLHYQRIFANGDLDPQTGIYRDAEDGPCDICVLQDENWKDRVIDDMVVYNSKFQVEMSS